MKRVQRFLQNTLNDRREQLGFPGQEWPDEQPTQRDAFPLEIADRNALHRRLQALDLLLAFATLFLDVALSEEISSFSSDRTSSSLFSSLSVIRASNALFQIFRYSFFYLTLPPAVRNLQLPQ